MPRTAAAVVLAIVPLIPAAASAQVSTPGPYVIDVRGVMSGSPGDASFYPPVTASTRVPQRAFGLSGGAHVYPFRFGLSRLGVGVDVVRVRGTADTEASTASSSQTAGVASTGTVTASMTVTTIAPQISFNFGTRDGWSYLSAGYGTTMTRGHVTIPNSAASGASASRERHSATINIGGGARWFLREHLAVGFDVRFHRLRATNGTPSKQIVALSVGVSLR